MIYIGDGAFDLLYPRLSLHGRGLVIAVELGGDPPVPALNPIFDNGEAADDKRRMDCFIRNMQKTGFALETSLKNFPRFASHECKVDGSCPATERRQNDGQELRLPYAGGNRGPSSMDVVWTLKASWTCAQSPTQNSAAFGENLSGRAVRCWGPGLS